MTTAEAAPAAAGPRYAPDDPTLPSPWKGLIDGSTGVLYYWNPETNITQYEKPAPAQPAASTPNLAPIPAAHSVQQGEMAGQHGHQLHQPAQQQASHVGQKHGQMMPQQQNSQMVQRTMQPQGQHLIPPQGQQMTQQQMQYPMHPQVMSSQHYGQGASQAHGSQIVQPPQAHQFTSQNMHYISYQPNMHTPGQQNSQQNQHNMHGHPFENHQDFKPAFPKIDEVEFKNDGQVGVSPSKYQQRDALSAESNQNQNIPAGISSGPSGQVPHASVNSAGQPKQFGGLSGGIQQSPSAIQMQQGTAYAAYQHGPTFQNQMGPGMMHGHPPNAHPVGQKMGHGDNLHARAGNEYFYNSNKEIPAMGSQQPNSAQMPISAKQQDMRVGNPPFQKAMPSGNGSGIRGHAMHNMFTPPIGGHPPLSSNSLTGPPYSRSSDVTDLTAAEIYCQQHEITATGNNVPPPFMTFEATGFPHEILREIYSAGFSNPTPIQAQTWPVALQGRDIVAIAKTGSGKTLGYLMPAFIKLRQRRNNPLNGPTVLVLAPTRELAFQIQDEATKFGRSSRVSCTCLYGGAPKVQQLKELERGADIVVATPGRLNDILEMKKIDFRQVSLLVLDEADRMLDMGFEPQIRKIVNEIPPRRQTLMYTATWPKDVRKIAGDLLVNPIQVNIGKVDELAANKAITQYVEFVPQMEKQRRLEQILRSQERGSKVIIFCSTKRLCDQLTRSIGRNYGAAAIHGDKNQTERDWVLNQFRSGKSPVLVATDVAARGLDIKDIRVVINYDFPTGVEDYVHRIGRTGRAGATGVSYTFFSEQDWKHAGDLIKVLEGANQRVPPELRQMTSRGPPSSGKDRGGMSRFDSGSGVGGRWDNGGRGGVRDSNFGGRGGMRDSGFGGRGGMRDGGRGGMRDGGFSNDAGFHGPGGQGGRGGDLFGGRGNRGRGFGGPRGGHAGSGWGRSDRGPNDRYSMDGRGRGRGRGRFDNQKDVAYRNRGRSHSRSPEKVRTWDYSSRSRSRSRSRSSSMSWSRDRSRRSRSRSRSWSCDRSRSYSRSISPHRGRSRRSYSRSPGRGRGHSYDRRDRTNQLFSDKKDDREPEVGASNPIAAPIPASTQGHQNSTLGTDNVEQAPVVGVTEPEDPNAPPS